MMVDVDQDRAAEPPDTTEDAVRARLLAALRDPAPHAENPLRTPSVHTERPMRRPPAALAAKQAARSRAGLPHEGGDPDAALWSALVLPTGLLAVTDLGIGGVAELATGGALSPVLTAVWLGSFATLGGVCANAARRLGRNGLRLTAAERRTLEASRHWESRQPWRPPLTGGPERRLVSMACDLVRRVTAGPVWAADYLDDQRLRLDLTAELDQIDAQAYRLATARPAGDAAEPAGPAWHALIDRVVALERYADELAALDLRLAARAAVEPDDAVPELAAGIVRDRYAAEDLRTLTDELRAITEEPR